MFRTSLLAAATLIVGAGAASAQEWSGFYAGGGVGYVGGESDTALTLGGQWSSESAPVRDGLTNAWTPSLDPEGYSIGLHGGYNHQFPGGFVIGGEFGYSYFDADDRRAGSVTPIVGLTYNVVNSVEIESAVDLRAKFGYSFGRFLGYATLGYSYGDVSASAEVLSNGGYSKIGSESEWTGGLTYGLGGEFSLGGPWSIRAEYTRTDYDEVNFATIYRPGSTFTSPAYTESFEQDLTLDRFAMGVNYNF